MLLQRYLLSKVHDTLLLYYFYLCPIIKLPFAFGDVSSVMSGAFTSCATCYGSLCMALCIHKTR